MTEEFKKLVAYCGLYCGDCFAHQGRIADLARELRKELRQARFDKTAEFLAKIPHFGEFKNFDECNDVLEAALATGRPGIFNTDQGSQFTSNTFTSILKSHDIRISMDGRGRALDNVFIERLWRTVKYENIYLKDYETVDDLIIGLDEFFHFYSRERPHQSLNGQTPWSVYQEQQAA